jgi:hypothetical protein
MANLGEPWGEAFSKGFAGSFSSVAEAGRVKASREAAAAERERQKRKDELELGNMYKERLKEGASIIDPKTRTLYFKQVFSSMEQNYGGKAPQALLDLARDPENFQRALAMADKQGLTMKDMWNAAGDPLLFSSALLAFDQATQAQASRESVSQAGVTTPISSGATPETEPNAAEINNLKQRIGEWTVGIQRAAAAGASEGALKELQRLKSKDEDRLLDLTKQRGTAESTAGEQPISAETYKAAEVSFPQLAIDRKIYPGQKYKDFRSAITEFMAQPKGQGQPSVPPAAGRRPTPTPGATQTLPPRTVTPPLPRPGATAPVSPPPVAPGTPLRREEPIVQRPLPSQGGPTRDPSGRVLPPVAQAELEKFEYQQQSQARNAPAPEWARDAYGITTAGEYAAAIASGKIRPMPKEEQERRKSAAVELEKVYAKEYADMVTKADESRLRRAKMEAMVELLGKAGETGRIVGPLRLGLNNIIATFGIKPEGMAPLEMLSRVSTQLGIARMKDIGGNDTQQELVKSIEAYPGVLNIFETNVLMLQMSIAQEMLEEHRAVMAEKWMNQPWNDTRSLSAKSPSGKTFKQVWSEWAGRPENSPAGLLAKSLYGGDINKIYDAMRLPRPGEKKPRR